MVDGINLSLYAGPMIAVPVSRSVIDALTSVRVTTATTMESWQPGEPPVSARSGFRLEFTLGKNSPLETIFLLAGSAPPMLRVVLAATINGITEVLIDGFAQNVRVNPGEGTRPGTLTVQGKDVTAAMDLIDFSGLPYPAMPITARVFFLLAKYGLLGVAPVVIPPVIENVPDPTDRIFSHCGTDYAYLTTLARECGYVFYSDPGPTPGVSKAYWGPEIKVGPPQPALNVDMDAMTNVESLSFSFDNERSTTPIAFLRTDAVPIPIPVPIPEASLINPPLGLVPPLSFRTEPLPDTDRMSLPQALLFGLARKSASAECVTGEGSLNVLRYGRLLKARQLVGVRGVGTAFNGLYFVKSVTHEINPGEYKQSFKLSRNGLVSTVPKVPV